MPQEAGRREFRSIGIQNSIGKDSIGTGRDNTRRYTDSDYRISKRLSRTRAYRNLLRSTISVAPSDEDGLLQSDKNGNTRGTQTTFYTSVDFPTTETTSRQNQNSNSGSFLEKPRSISAGSSTLSDQNTISEVFGRSKAREFRESRCSENVEEPLALLDGDDGLGAFDVENSLQYIFHPADRTGSSRRSNEDSLTREDYQSYDIRNAAGRQDATSETSRGGIRYRCCRKKRSLPSISTRPVPIVIEEALPKRESSIYCRICHEGSDVDPLIQPCLCKGTVGNVHARCLKNWLEQSNTSRCELCNYPYAIRQTRKYTKYTSVQVFFKVVISKRSLIYDLISFFIITPLAVAGIAVCAQASLGSSQPSLEAENAVHIANITKAGMIMLCAVIIIAYCIWLLALLSSYYKCWKKWYDNCFDVEVIPVRMTSEDRREATVRFLRERETTVSREQVPRIFPVFQAPPNYSHRHPFHQRRLTSAVRSTSP